MPDVREITSDADRHDGWPVFHATAKVATPALLMARDLAPMKAPDPVVAQTVRATACRFAARSRRTLLLVDGPIAVPGRW